MKANVTMASCLSKLSEQKIQKTVDKFKRKQFSQARKRQDQTKKLSFDLLGNVKQFL